MKDYIISGVVFVVGVGLAVVTPFFGTVVILAAVGLYGYNNYEQHRSELTRYQLEADVRQSEENLKFEREKQLLAVGQAEQEKFDVKLAELNYLVKTLENYQKTQEPIVRALVEKRTNPSPSLWNKRDELDDL